MYPRGDVVKGSRVSTKGAAYLKGSAVVAKGGATTKGDPVASGPGTVTLPTPFEPITPAQLTTILGFGSEAIWKCINPLNDLSGPQYPTLGPVPFTPSAGGIPGIAGPMGSEDFGVQATDADTDGQWSMTANVLNPNNRKMLLMIEATMPLALPAANRLLTGWDGVNDYLIQFQTNGQPRAVAISGATVSTPGIAVDHSDGGSHTFMADFDPGVAISLTTDLGTASVATGALGALDLQGAPFIHRNNNALASTVWFYAMAYSDGSVAQNTAMDNLMANKAAAIANWRAFMGLP